MQPEFRTKLMFKCGKLAEFVPELNIVFLVGFRRRTCAEFNSHLDFFELLNLTRCGSNSAYELGLNHFPENIFRATSLKPKAVWSNG